MQNLRSTQQSTQLAQRTEEEPASNDSGVYSGSDISTSIYLGQGGCGKVSVVVDKNQRQFYVEKTPLENHLKPRCMQVMQRESKTLDALDHPNIISKVDTLSDDEQWCDSITMEYGGVDLSSSLNPSTADIVGLGTTTQKKQVLTQIAEALKYLHKNNKIHRDIKPQNILVNGYQQVKLCDFGELLEFDSNSYDLSQAGTPEYCSPDINTGAGWTPASDMWSFGCVMYKVLTGQDLLPELANKTKFPMTLYLEVQDGMEAFEFDTADELLDWMYCTIQDRLSGNISDPQARTLLQNLLSIDPSNRPSASYLCAHPWFRTGQSRVSELFP